MPGTQAAQAMRVIFAGTPEFAAVALAELLAAGFTVPLVLTQPDRPAGRGMKLQMSAVKQLALAHGIPVAQPRSLRLEGKYPDEASAAFEAIKNAAADACVVAAYGLILPQWVLDAPRLGCFNIHASLLPRWRGAAPIHRAIEAGDAQTGVTLMQMDAGLDTGDMLASRALPMPANATTASLHDTLAALGAAMMVALLHDAHQGRLAPKPQPAEGITYAHKIDKAEALINWANSAAVIEQRVRAFNPFPGAHTLIDGEALKVWGAHVQEKISQIDSNKSNTSMPEGHVLSIDSTGVTVQTGAGQLCLTALQRAGGKRLAAAEFLRGNALAVGAKLG